MTEYDVGIRDLLCVVIMVLGVVLASSDVTASKCDTTSIVQSLQAVTEFEFLVSSVCSSVGWAILKLYWPIQAGLSRQNEILYAVENL
jgi:hypothetical protein